MICARGLLNARIPLQCLRHFNITPESTLTTQEMSAALRPFYFAVHPDLFWQHPQEKHVNENSLKLLNSYLECLQKKLQPAPAKLQFYVRFTGVNPTVEQQKDLKAVHVTLNSQDLHTTVHSILSRCELSTDFIDRLKPSPTKITKKQQYDPEDSFGVLWKRGQEMSVDYASEKLRDVKDINLRKWLIVNARKARISNEACQATKVEVIRLSNILIEVLDLNDIIWDCGWGISQFRGCLQSFYQLAGRYPEEMKVLAGRTLVFGSQTGVSLDGCIILSSGDVKHWWIDLLRSVPKYDGFLSQLPEGERELSEVLRGIHIDHRKFQPTVMVKSYIGQLKKLSTALYKYRWVNGLPESWPRRMEDYQLVVECEAGPLMLSPTGQFIVPASCPAFLLVSFISENLDEATNRIQQYNREKLEESHIYDRCLKSLGLASLQKDDNVTPALMISCCQRLLQHSHHWEIFLRGSDLRISNFYSVLQDGEICIPWNWKVDQPMHGF